MFTTVFIALNRMMIIKQVAVNWNLSAAGVVDKLFMRKNCLISSVLFSPSPTGSPSATSSPSSASRGCPAARMFGWLQLCRFVCAA